MHRSAAERTLRKALRSRGLGCWICCTLEKSEAEREQCGSLPVGKEAEVADADEAAWEQVQEEAAQELIDRQAHQALLVAVGGISPTEADVAFGEGDQSAVGDADAVGVRTEIPQGMFRSTEGSLGVDHQSCWNRSLSQVAKLPGSASGARLPWNSSEPSRKAPLRPSTNLPRKTRLSTLTGRKKLVGAEIQWL